MAVEVNNKLKMSHTITPSQNEARFQAIEIDYDVNEDTYYRRSDGNQRIPGWKTLAFQTENMFRKEEFDHQMRYLSRKGNLFSPN